ncbi:sulfotransferase [Methanocaldococcus vulcanius M7]|uniref:Sulfotransferase n=1 Tax=Methanocaldococcus vulcanius (strain ATCC 700851 / DSM 12094 / M7) TaxID=579137 RepID=C9RED4_METVM|nr:sulfotransferase [Methanocaldococcus vulcanius]ACX71936.1 sulfotransferase [Methanocaldococcus vulcanius M7]
MEKTINFIGIGTPKSGTTWLAKCLSEHPEIFIPEKKEIHFFNKYDYCEKFEFEENYKKGIEWYLSHFNSEKPIKGEFSPSYFSDPLAYKRIKEHFPNIKLIVIFRNPIERLYSSYFYVLPSSFVLRKYFEELKNLKYITFEDYLKVAKWDIDIGFYYKHLQKWLSVFDREQIFICFHDDIVNNPEKLLKDLYEFLGVNETSYIPESLKRKENVGVLPDTSSKWYKLFNKFEIMFSKSLYKYPQVYNVVRKLNLGKIYQNMYKKLAYKRDKKPEMRKETKEYLINLYRDDILSLSEFTGRDLSHWLKI